MVHSFSTKIPAIYVGINRSFPANGCLVALIREDAIIDEKSYDYNTRQCIKTTLHMGDMPKGFAITHTTPLLIPRNIKQKRIVMVQLTKQSISSYFKLIDLSHKIAKAIINTNAKHVILNSGIILQEYNKYSLDKNENEIQESDVISIFLRELLLQQLFSKNKSIESINFIVSAIKKEHSSVIANTVAISRAMHWSIELSNLPSNKCTPKILAQEAKKICSQFTNLTLTIHSTNSINKLNMGGVLAISKGSVNAPYFIEVSYKPKKSTSKKPIVLVGKGVTFDSGGISLKPSKQMDEMKYDMCGASTTLATIFACAYAKLPIHVQVLVPVVENMPSGSSIKPGDVITTHSGKTIEILNTDAEGRVILADMLSYAENFKPRFLIDVATLTGACITALGRDFCAVISNQQELADTLIQSGRKAFDCCWQLPLHEPYRESLHSNFASIANIGNGEAGTIIGAVFLKDFVNPKTPWAHLDIASVAWKSGITKSATGRPIPLLYAFIQSKLDYN
ncbi:MAG: leucyl aminopeptidase [Methylacidiphilales bacterium]|nr:leucyl aminopeptidase [Candidatus Methylacidiphilales bacterium]